MALRVLSDYKIGKSLVHAAGDVLANLSQEAEDALLRDSPGSFERVEVQIVTPLPDANIPFAEGPAVPVTTAPAEAPRTTAVRGPRKRGG